MSSDKRVTYTTFEDASRPVNRTGRKLSRNFAFRRGIHRGKRVWCLDHLPTCLLVFSSKDLKIVKRVHRALITVWKQWDYTDPGSYADRAIRASHIFASGGKI